MDLADFQRRLGKAVAEHRRLSKMTQEQLAERVESSTEWISQVERGVGTPSMELLLHLSVALGVSPAFLIEAACDETRARTSVLRLMGLAQGLSDQGVGVVLATAEAVARVEGAES